MEYLCTTCSRRKRRDPGPLPAARRYLSRRIRAVERESRRQGRPLLILSGRYGLLEAEEKIPWYDEALTGEAVEALAVTVSRQLAGLGATSIAFHARPRDTPGWAPYHEVLERACRRAGVALAVRILEDR